MILFNLVPMRYHPPYHWMQDAVFFGLEMLPRNDAGGDIGRGEIVGGRIASSISGFDRVP